MWFEKRDKALLARDCVVDVIVLLVTMLHISHLQRRGLWGNNADRVSEHVLRSAAPIAVQGNAFSRFMEELAPTGTSNGIQRLMPKLNEEIIKDNESLIKAVSNQLGTLSLFKTGFDNYALAFGIQITLLLFTILGFGSISSVEDFTEELSNNQFNGSMVAMAALVVVIILVDRVAYIRRWMRLKVVLQLSATILMHIIIFFVVPISAKIRFQDSSYLALFYVLVSTYLGVSAKQIKLGYTVFPGNDVVSKEYSAAGSVAFKSFRLIPYVREMRSILEWMFADTSLDIFMWLKFDDLYAWLLAVRYDKAYRKRSKKILSGDEGQSLLWKILYGWIVFVGMLLIVFGPMLLFSTLNPALSRNPVLGASISVQLSSRTGNSYFSLYSSGAKKRADVSTPSGAILDQVRSEFSNLIAFDPKYDKLCQAVQMPPYSASEWLITPPGLRDMQELLLNENADISVIVEYSFARRIGQEDLDINAEATQLLSWENHRQARCDLAQRLGVNVTRIRRFCKTSGERFNIKVPYPAIIRLPSGENVKPKSLSASFPDGAWNIVLSISGSSSAAIQDWIAHSTTPNAPRQPSLWWTVATSFGASCEKNPGKCMSLSHLAGGGSLFLVASDEVFHQLSALLPSYGISSIYLSIVLVVGTYLRSFLYTPMNIVPYQEIKKVDVDVLLEICECIILVRHEEYQGRRKDEVKLYFFLIELCCEAEVLHKLGASRLKDMETAGRIRASS